MSETLENQRSESGGLRLLRSASSFYQSLFDDLKRAQKTVRIQMYCVQDGEIGGVFQKLLTGCAMRGVRVDLIYDSAGSIYTPASYFSAMAEAGVNVVEYHPIRLGGILARFGSVKRFFRRNHRKLIVIDSNIYYLGGMNIGDRFLEWEDVMIRGEGAPVALLDASFDRTLTTRWRRKRQKRRERMETRLAGNIEVWDSRPRVDNYPVKRLYINAIKRAKKRVWIAQAYFVPRRRLIKTLIKAANRGVDVRVIAPEKSDVKIVDMASWPSVAKLLKHGVKVYRFKPSMLHTKMALIDGKWLSIGTANLDSLSMYWNMEINLVIREKEIAAEAEEIFRDYLSRSREVDVDEPKRRPLHLRVIGRLLHYYGWIL